MTTHIMTDTEARIFAAEALRTKADQLLQSDIIKNPGRWGWDPTATISVKATIREATATATELLASVGILTAAPRVACPRCGATLPMMNYRTSSAFATTYVCPADDCGRGFTITEEN